MPSLDEYPIPKSLEQPDAEQMESRIDAAGLVVEIAAADRVSLSRPVMLTMTVRNPTDATRTFCDYHTPFEGIRNRIFIIHNDRGESISYRGIMAKRVPPDPDDYILLAPGNERSAAVDLRAGYDLTTGTHTVHYLGSSISGLGDSNSITIEITP